MIILGLDPGTTIVGYGIIEKTQNTLRCLDYGIIKSPMTQNRDKFLNIHIKITELIKKHKPDTAAIEKLFFFKNLKTAIAVSEARGVMILTCVLNHIPLQEYTPLQIKQAVTGYGKADKQQVQKMVKIILNLNIIPKPDDAADALATAICRANTNDDLFH
ncbi:MAG: crossover junction endodeoxyribonuclease RuvC [Patescibacteria group bacterium]